jgi:hypothetical protein
MLEVVADLHSYGRSDPRKAVDHGADQGPARSRRPIKVLLSIESNSLRASSADSTGIFPCFTTYLGPRPEAPGLTSKMPTVIK